MSFCKSFGLALFAAVCLLGETAGSAHAQCGPSVFLCATERSGGSVISLGGLPGFVSSEASSINNVGQVVGVSFFGSGSVSASATEWSGGSIINLGGLPGFGESNA